MASAARSMALAVTSGPASSFMGSHPEAQDELRPAQGVPGLCQTGFRCLARPPERSRPVLPREADEIGRLIAKGNSKSAVEAAKLLHKKVGTPASEALLVDAYAARIRSMLEHRMTAEADALVAMVRQRYPGWPGGWTRFVGL